MNMRLVLSVAVLAGFLAAQGLPREEYQKRRAGLQKSLDGVMVLFGAVESEDLHTGFFQETNFLYLSGWREPGAAMLIAPQEEILFLPPRNPRAENFTGRKLAAEDADASQKTGFAKVLPRSALQANLMRVLENASQLYTLPGDAEARKLKQLALFHAESDASRPIAQLRMIKSPAEIALIARATDVTVAAHLAAWKMLKPGEFEYEIAAAMTNTYFSRGCERSAYAPIVGSGPNSVVLHYMTNHRKTDAGEVVVMDVGAECSDYATDVTRTVPTSGKFTPRQREIYEIVLGAQKAAIAAVKPGARLRGEGRSLQQIAVEYIDSHGKDLHGEKLGKYFTHGLSHHVGLDVHDASDNSPLKPGMVITIEPGIYIPEENIGIRIEDTLVVTENGARNLSAALPREVEEIEKLIGK
jgi:Xaa-Pro aminopeptidase